MSPLGMSKRVVTCWTTALEKVRRFDVLANDSDVRFQLCQINAGYCVFHTAIGELQLYRVLSGVKDVDTQVCLQVKMPVVEGTMMGLATITTGKFTVAFEFQSLDVYTDGS